MPKYCFAQAQRLKMAAFTIPIAYDKTYLVIPRPEAQDTLSDQVRKVLQPFSPDLWCMILGTIALAALLSVWFEDRTISTSPRGRTRDVAMHTGRRKRRAYARLFLDSILQKGTVRNPDEISLCD